MTSAFNGPLVWRSFDRQIIGSSKIRRAETVHCASSGLMLTGICNAYILESSGSAKHKTNSA